MNNQLSRDDNRINRLSSFLYVEGNLLAKKLYSIKQNVYFLEASTGECYILKGHLDAANMKQQWDFFEAIRSPVIVPFVRFPNGKKEISIGTNYYWTISPYIPGRKLSYQIEEDRERAVRAVKQFHHHASGIYLHNTLKKPLFYKRWQSRLYKLKETEAIFHQYGYSTLFDDILLTMKESIEIVSGFPWYQDQLEAEQKGMWVHGDVASHNFIQNERSFIIDFDLLHCTTPLYDYIQLGQRFLPTIDWDVEQLLAYDMIDDEKLEQFLYSVFIPSDLVREWLHFLSKRGLTSVESYLQTMEMEWIQRKKFLTNSKIMVK
ncbi:phosphotransferase [Ornithinibacillus contaminans]|uniref:phosphotransferase n=1 Tax=Ornithinibacillus contaminans TaxID=694055 RepID=UPI00064E103B|nr:phosphotransferase [Ornithinibacillus contaminans]